MRAQVCIYVYMCVFAGIFNDKQHSHFYYQNTFIMCVNLVHSKMQRNLRDVYVSTYMYGLCVPLVKFVAQVPARRYLAKTARWLTKMQV